MKAILGYICILILPILIWIFDKFGWWNLKYGRLIAVVLVVIWFVVGSVVFVNKCQNEKAEKLQNQFAGRILGKPQHIIVGGSLWEFTSTNGVVFSDQGEPILTVKMVDGVLKISATIRNQNGALVAEMRDNEWEVSPTRAFDRNFTDTALEVRDASGAVVLQIVIFEGVISLQAIFHNRNGVTFAFVAQPDSVEGQGTAFGMWDPATGNPPQAKIEPIFLSGRLHMGECPGLDRIHDAIRIALQQKGLFVFSEPIEIGRAKQLTDSDNPKTVHAEISADNKPGLPILEPFFESPYNPAVIDHVLQFRNDLNEQEKQRMRISLVLKPLPYVVGLINNSSEPAIKVSVFVFDPKLNGYLRTPYGLDQIPIGSAYLFGVGGNALPLEEVLGSLRLRNFGVEFIDQLLQRRDNAHILVFNRNLDGFPFLSYTDFGESNGKYSLGLTSIVHHGLKE